jgi:tetratricopeptide (TPR) repeat protein
VVASSTNAPVEFRAQEAIDQLRREFEQNASRNSDAINAGLSLIEPTLNRIQERQMEALRSTNRTILMVAGIFAVIGFLGLVFISLLLVRAIGRFSEMAVIGSPRALLGAGAGHPLSAIGTGEMLPVRAPAVEQATGRFQGAIEQLQRRIQELEQSLHVAASVPHAHAGPPMGEITTGASNIQPLLSVPAAPVTEVAGGGASAAGAGEAAPALSRASVLVGKGQALLNLDAAEQALQCFDEALTLDPGNAEVLVKKGMALEKMQDWEQALENYNRAIALEPTLTVAYLYRGGVCNRLQRYREALESYEEALRSEKKSRVG